MLQCSTYSWFTADLWNSHRVHPHRTPIARTHRPPHRVGVAHCEEGAGVAHCEGGAGVAHGEEGAGGALSLQLSDQQGYFTLIFTFTVLVIDFVVALPDAVTFTFMV